jgi:hypothetical protein
MPVEGAKKLSFFPPPFRKIYDRSHSEYSEYSEIQRNTAISLWLRFAIFRNGEEKNERFFPPLTGITRNGR